MIGCTCEVCSSTDLRDRRTRPSIWVRLGDVEMIVDTTPELRLQCLAAGIDRIDAVLFTHHHADHVFGFDDLRRFNWIMHRPVACYGSERTLRALREMFRYAFEPAGDSPHSRPHVELKLIDSDSITIGGETVVPIPVQHGPLPVLGFRFGNFAYCTDCNHIPDDSMARLEGVEVLVLDAVRRKPHPAHFSLDEAVVMAERIGARQTYFTHMAHEFPHQATNHELPEGMELAYDGLRITI